jgi:hypothetical protein
MPLLLLLNSLKRDSVPTQLSGLVKKMPTKRVGASILGSASTKEGLAGDFVVEQRVWGDMQ